MYFLDCCISRNVVHVCPSGETYCLGSSHTSHEVLERVLYLFIYLFMVLVYVNIFFFFLQFSDIEKCLKKKKKKSLPILHSAHSTDHQVHFVCNWGGLELESL